MVCNFTVPMVLSEEYTKPELIEQKEDVSKDLSELRTPVISAFLCIENQPETAATCTMHR